MQPGGYLQKLWRVITELNLDVRRFDHVPELASIFVPDRQLLELGLFTEEQARDFLLALEPLIKYATDRPNCLYRPPSQTELGKFDIEVGHLVDAPDARSG